jgi:hypothetical protein
MNDNFEDIKVGDKIILHNRNGSAVVTVGRLTAKQLVTKNPEYKFWKKNGSYVGGTVWDHNHITRATDEEIEKITRITNHHKKASKVFRLFHDANFRLMGGESLDALIVILEKEKN